jgi:hypothetical protein
VKNADDWFQVTSGQYDLIFCASNCTGQIRKAGQYFPNADVSSHTKMNRPMVLLTCNKPFFPYIQPDTGHGMNLHYNASGLYRVINGFFTENVGA